jgi:predicted transcriptional regulator
MIDFACKKFDINEIIKCSLSLTKADYRVLKLIMAHKEEFTSEDIANRLNLNNSTAQRALKKLHEKNIITRTQRNLKHGYIFKYHIKNRKEVIEEIKKIIREWTEKVNKELEEI